MHKLFGLIPAVFTILLGILFFTTPQPALAADVRTGENVFISEDQKNLKDLYLFGRTIDLNAPVTNDVVATGGTVNFNNDISNNIMAAGGTINLNGKTGNTARIAGGTITVNGSVKNDLVVAGGNVTIDKDATISGDLIIAGGQLRIDGPVKGKILVSGGDVTINNSVGGNVSAGQIGTLTLGPQAKINGNLTYSSGQQAIIDSGSTVRGQTTFHRVEKQQNKQQTASAAIGSSVYQLIIDIILSLLLLYFFRNGLITLFTRMKEAPWRSLGIGFAYTLLAPLASLILLILIWLGIASFILYAFVLIVSIYITKIFIGWWIMTWWQKREKKSYSLDWKAGVAGPIILFFISLIPVLGWLVSAIICLIAIGSFVETLVGVVPRLQGTNKK